MLMCQKQKGISGRLFYSNNFIFSFSLYTELLKKKIITLLIQYVVFSVVYILLSSFFLSHMATSYGFEVF